MAKSRFTFARWFAEADAADNVGKTLPANGTTVKVQVPAGWTSNQLRVIWHNGDQFAANIRNLKPLTKGERL